MQSTIQSMPVPVAPNSNRNTIAKADNKDSVDDSRFGDVLKKHLSSEKEDAPIKSFAPKKSVAKPHDKTNEQAATTDEKIDSRKGMDSEMLQAVLNSSINSDTLSPSTEEKLSPSEADDLIALISGAGMPGFYLPAEQITPTSKFSEVLTESQSADIFQTGASKRNAGKIDVDLINGAQSKTEQTTSTYSSVKDKFYTMIDNPISSDIREARPSSAHEETQILERVNSIPGVTTSSTLPKDQPILPAALENIPVPVGSNKWGNDVGQKVVWLIKNEESTATLTLNPPELGPMKVVVHVENGQAHANFSSDQPEVRQALLEAMPKLREVMEEAGIPFGQANVSQNSSGNYRDNQKENGQQEKDIFGIDQSSKELSSLTPPNTQVHRRGLIDTFV